jgi:ribosome-binding factor A
MVFSRRNQVKRSQKESFLLQEVAALFLRLSLDEKILHDLYVTRVELSPEGGTCTVFFHTPAGHDSFNERKKHLILYKPSMRASLAKTSHSRYVPDLKFAYDEGIEKQQRMEELFNKLKTEGKL